jgi:hypothetical protein
LGSAANYCNFLQYIKHSLPKNYRMKSYTFLFWNHHQVAKHGTVGSLYTSFAINDMAHKYPQCINCYKSTMEKTSWTLIHSHCIPNHLYLFHISISTTNLQWHNLTVNK